MRLLRRRRRRVPYPLIPGSRRRRRLHTTTSSANDGRCESSKYVRASIAAHTPDGHGVTRASPTQKSMKFPHVRKSNPTKIHTVKTTHNTIQMDDKMYPNARFATRQNTDGSESDGRPRGSSRADRAPERVSTDGREGCFEAWRRALRNAGRSVCGCV